MNDPSALSETSVETGSSNNPTDLGTTVSKDLASTNHFQAAVEIAVRVQYSQPCGNSSQSSTFQQCSLQITRLNTRCSLTLVDALRLLFKHNTSVMLYFVFYINTLLTPFPIVYFMGVNCVRHPVLYLCNNNKIGLL